MATLSAPAQASTTPRLQWRVVVNSTAKKGVQGSMGHLAWHMSACTSPDQVDSHCAVGQESLAALGNPEGHCMVDGVCLRCASLESQMGISVAPQSPAVAIATSDVAPEVPAPLAAE